MKEITNQQITNPQGYDMTFAEYIKQERTKRLMNSSEFGKLIGTSNSTVYLWESGRTPYMRSARKIAKALNIEPAELAKIIFSTLDER